MMIMLQKLAVHPFGPVRKLGQLQFPASADFRVGRGVAAIGIADYEDERLILRRISGTGRCTISSNVGTRRPRLLPYGFWALRRCWGYGPSIASGLVAGAPQLCAGAALGTSVGAEGRRKTLSTP